MKAWVKQLGIFAIILFALGLLFPRIRLLGKDLLVFNGGQTPDQPGSVGMGQRGSYVTQEERARIQNAVIVTDEQPFLVPSDDALQVLSNEELTDIWWRYIYTVQAFCRNQIRLGSLKDGGKEVCIDKDYRPGTPCLVYSMGSNYKTDFEDAVIKNYNCEVHTFDPSTPEMGKNGKGTIPKGMQFHSYGLGGNDTTDQKGWVLKTLGTIMKELNHNNKTLDIFKIDIEQGEYAAVPEILDSGVYQQIKQMQIEFHTWLNKPSKIQMLQLLRRLYEYGFRIFMRELNTTGCLKKEKDRPLTSCYELAMINMCYRQKCK